MKNATKTNKYDEILPTRLRDLLSETGTTQQQLADYCKVERQTIAKWKDGITCPDADALRKLSQYFNISSDYLIGTSDNRTTDRATRELCDTLGLSDRSVAFLQGRIDPITVSVLRKITSSNVNKLLSESVKSIQAAVNYLIEEHIEACISLTSDRSVLDNISEFRQRLSMPSRTVTSYQGMVNVTNSDGIDEVIDTSTDGFWHVKIKEALLTSNIQEITAILTARKNKALREGVHDET